jgi:hypothetical protein
MVTVIMIYVIITVKDKSVLLHAMKALGGEEV